MYDRKEITPEFYDKLSDSEKKELVQVMLEEQLSDPLHIKGLPKLVQNYIKKIADNIISDKEYPEAGDILEIDGIKEYNELQKRLTDLRSKYEKKCIYVSDRCISRNLTDMPYPIMMESDIRRMRDDVVKPITKEIFDKLVSRGTNVYDRYGRMFLLDSMYTPNKFYIHYPRSNGRVYKSWFWLNELIRAISDDPYPTQSYSIDEFPMYPKPITTVQLKSVIFWDAGDQDYLNNLKVRDSRFKQLWMDENIRNYHFNDSPIADTILDSLATIGPDLNSAYGMSTPNLNNEDKKRLERVIKRRKKK